MKGPALRDVGKFLGKLAGLVVKAAGIISSITGDGGSPIIPQRNVDELVEALQQLATESDEINARLHDMALDEEADEKQMAEMHDVITDHTREFQSIRMELANLRASLAVVVQIVGVEAFQAGMARNQSAGMRQGDVTLPTQGSVEHSGWQNLRGPGGATPLGTPVEFPKSDGAS